jgi:molecular chaperone DnaK (HSP70)
MSAQQPKHLQHSTIPSILSYDHRRETYVIGDEARAMGVRGITNAYGFKELVGKSDTEYEKPSRYWIAPTGESDSFTKTLSAKEVAKQFLSILLRNILEPAKLIIGIPAIGDEAWRGNYKRHIKELFRDIGRPPPDFFFEPFAVYQFYRNRYHNDEQSRVGPETVLIIDVGGSTFDSLIVRTTREGYLPRSGAASRPLGARGEFFAGRDLDLLLLDRLVENAKMMGHKWKDDPRKRILAPSGACVLPIIEDAKIGLSNKIPRNAPLKTSYADYELPVKFPAGTLHQDDEIATTSNGDDLKQTVDAMWTTRWKDIVFDTITAAEKTLANAKQQLRLFDRVFVAGGCANLPFFSEGNRSDPPLEIPPSTIVTH